MIPRRTLPALLAALLPPPAAPAALVALGRACLRAHPALARQPPPDPSTLAESIRADFAAGRILDVGGWRLARAEALHAAHAALRA